MRISDWSSDVCSSDLSNLGLDVALPLRVILGRVGPVYVRPSNACRLWLGAAFPLRMILGRVGPVYVRPSHACWLRLGAAFPLRMLLVRVGPVYVRALVAHLYGRPHCCPRLTPSVPHSHYPDERSGG